MSLSEEEKTALAVQVMANHFPGINEAVAVNVITFAIDGFEDDYSPVVVEQEHPGRGSGTGVNFQEYVIFMGRSLTNNEPIAISREQLGQILVKCLTY